MSTSHPAGGWPTSRRESVTAHDSSRAETWHADQMTEVSSGRLWDYRERLWPGALGWAMAAGAGVVTVLALIPVDRTLAITVATAPVVEVRAGELRAGRAHIPVALLGEGVAVAPEARRDALGRDLDARAYVCLRAWIPAM